MARTTSVFPAALAALLAAGAPAAAQTTGPGLPAPTLPQGAGVNIHFTDPQPGEMERFAAAGYGVARMDLFWGAVEKQKGVYDFSAYDRLLGHLTKAGARTLFILDYGNDLYQKGAPTTPEARAAYARFAAEAARHYAGRGVLFELWNEPNLGQFWQPKPDPNDYAALAVGAAKAMRAADLKATILGPGVSGFPWEYLDAAFKAGLLEHVDAVSVHPYRARMPESAAEDFARLRVLVARYAPKGKEYLPLVSSEWGYSTNTKSGVGEDVQAAYLTRMWLANLAAGVNLSIFYDWKDDGDDPAENEHRFGTVRRDLTPKPSFEAARKLIADLRGYTFRHRLAPAAPDDWALLFQRGDTDDLALVTWKAVEGAPGEAGTPRARKVGRADPQFVALRRLASVRYPAGPLVEGAGLKPSLLLSVRNPDDSTVRGIELVVQAAVGSLGTFPSSASGEVSLNLPSGLDRAPSRSVPVRVRWGGRELPVTPAPLTVLRLDPLTLSAAPRGNDLLVTVENPGRTPFQGRVLGFLVGGTKQGAEAPLTLVAGQERATVRLPAPPPGAPFVVTVRGAADGPEVASSYPLAFLPFAGFGEGYRATEYVENEAQPPTPLRTVPLAGPDDPAPTGLEFRYSFDKGWRYTQIAPEQPATIPPAAKALLLWVKADGSGDFLRARYRDATGQTFQVDLPALTWTGWRLVSVPVDGSGVGVHWGGANDGKLHRPLTWEAVALIDSANRETPHGGTVVFAGPAYLADPAELPIGRGLPPPSPFPAAVGGAKSGGGGKGSPSKGFPFPIKKQGGDPEPKKP